MIPTREQVEAAAAAILSQGHPRPRVGVILGTGLSDFTHEIQSGLELPYEAIPHFARATAPTHRGTLVLGQLSGVPLVAIMAASMPEVTAAHPSGPRIVRLGVETLIISNACGGMNPDYRVGDLMLVEDQINLTFANPLVGPHDDHLGSRCPDMSRPFDPGLIDAAFAIARRENFRIHRGVYVGVLGPNYETRAEYRMFRRLGGDAVGMSTVHEVIAARQCGLRVLALSVVTNECRPEDLQGADSHEVESVATAAAPKVQAIIQGLVAGQ